MAENEHMNQMARALRLTTEARMWCDIHVVGTTPFNTIRALDALGYLKPADDERADGAALITEERRRQVEGEGWTPEHDDQWTSGELAAAAGCYALVDVVRAAVLRVLLLHVWKWDLGWWKPKDVIRNLVRAGALCAAEIDRRQRKAARDAVNGWRLRPAIEQARRLSQLFGPQ